MRIVLRARSWWSFLEGVSAPEAVARIAAQGGLEALAVADVGTLAALPRLAAALPRSVRLLVAVEMVLRDAGRALLLARDATGLASLARALGSGATPPPDGLAAVGLDPDRLPALAARFDGRCWAGVKLVDVESGDERRRLDDVRRRILMRAAAARLELPLASIDEAGAAAEIERDAALARRQGRPAPSLERLAAFEPSAEDRAVIAGSERLVADLPDARALLAIPGGGAAGLAAAVLEAARREGVRARLRPPVSPDEAPVAVEIEPHSGPSLAAHLGATLDARIARASEAQALGVRDACALAARATGLGLGAMERLLRAARADADLPASALTFFKLDAADARVARAAAMIPRLALVPQALKPGRTLVATPEGGPRVADRLPVVPATPVGILATEAAGLEALGFATVALHADALTGVLGELARLGVEVPPPENAPAAGEPAVAAMFADGLALAQAEARAPAAVLCARLRIAPGMSASEVQRLVAAARRRGVHVLPARVDRSAWIPALEDDGVRLGLNAILGPSRDLRLGFERTVAAGLPATLADFVKRTGFPPAAMQRLAAAGALRAYAPTKEEALRQVKMLRFKAGEELPLFA